MIGSLSISRFNQVVVSKTPDCDQLIVHMNANGFTAPVQSIGCPTRRDVLVLDIEFLLVTLDLFGLNCETFRLLDLLL